MNTRYYVQVFHDVLKAIEDNDALVTKHQLRVLKVKYKEDGVLLTIKYWQGGGRHQIVLQINPGGTDGLIGREELEAAIRKSTEDKPKKFIGPDLETILAFVAEQYRHRRAQESVRRTRLVEAVFST